MVIENINSYTQNAMSTLKNDANNVNKQQPLNILNVNKISNIDKKDTTYKIIRQKIEHLKCQLRASQASEQQAQSGMSFLQEKEICLDTIKGVGDKLKELSKQYKKSNLSEEDKAKVEDQADKLLKGMDKLMNGNNLGDNVILDYKAIPIKDRDEKTSVILSKSLDITLEVGKLDDAESSNEEKSDIFSDKHFKSKVSTKALLENTSIIDERILKPVQEAIEDVDSAKSDIYDKFTDSYWSTVGSINELFESGGISAYDSNVQMDFQESLYGSISSLFFQSSNINKDNVYELLR